MARFCRNCGAHLPEDADFCPECGTAVPVAPPQEQFCRSCGAKLSPGAAFCAVCGQRVTPGAAAPAEKRPVRRAAPQRAAREKQSPPPPKPSAAAQVEKGTEEKKKSGGGFKRFVAFLLAAALLFTGFVRPGFILNKLRPPTDPGIKPSGTPTEKPNGRGVSGGTRGLSTEIPQLPDQFGHSKEIAASPCDGVFVSAPADAFETDTDVQITPVTAVDEQVMEAIRTLDSEGALAVAAFEVDAGLSDEDIIPGTYTVTVDLNTLGLSEQIHSSVTAYRVADDGTYYEYATEVKDGKLTYSSDQNSVVLIVARVIVYGALIYFGYPTAKEILTNFYETEYAAPCKYFYDSKKKEFTYEGKNPYASYRIHWAMEDLDIDVGEKTRRLEEITKSYADRANEIYKQYEEDKLFEKGNLFYLFSRNKSVAEVLAEAVEKDPEYQKIAKELKAPEPVEFCIKCVDEAFTFLKRHEYVKMPTGVVEIVSTPNGDASMLASATARILHESYVEVNLGAIKGGDQAIRDNFLMTMTHELLHVCQQKYRVFWADSNRFDEMVAVYMEPRALDYYHAEGIIDWDSNPPLSTSDYWTTLKLPIDKYYDDKTGATMRYEGYNLALFVEYLQEKTGLTLWTERLMRAKSYIKEGGISAPLMSIFGINEMEFDIHYRNFIRKNKAKMAQHYDTKEPEQYKRNAEVNIAKGGKYHVDVQVEGSYSSEVRGFRQENLEGITLLLVPDKNLANDQPEFNLVPVDRYEAIPQGAYIYPKEAKNNLNRDILEIHGALGNAGLERNSGYTIYALDRTKVVIPGEDEDKLTVKLPENSVAAEDGVIDGYLLKIEADNGETLQREIDKADFEKTIEIDKERLYGRTDRAEELTVTITLCEFVRKDKETRLAGEESEPVYYTMGSVKASGLNLFTDCWVPTEYDQLKDDCFVLGLIYIEEDNEFGYFESQYRYWMAEGRWTEVKAFAYDEKSGELTIDFDNGPATFQINDSGNLIMTNYGGAYEFYRAPR